MSINGRLRRAWDRLHQWLSTQATQPAWLPSAWRSPWVSYVCAGALTVGIGVILTIVSMATSGAVQSASRLLLVDVIVALAFGPGPSLLSAFLGAFLLDYFILLPSFAWSYIYSGKAVIILVFAVVGCAISLLVSRVERARAQKEASEQETVRRMDEFLAVAGHN